MRILLTNDDGIQSPCLEVLEKIASELTDDVWVVAPEIDNSGASHSLTLAEPLRLRELGNRHYGVKGTPTDCVIMGVRLLLKDKPPQLVISGVNRGQNLADDVTYSGTVAGAIQGTLLGIPSMAMSLVTGRPEGEPRSGQPLWETPMCYGAELVRKLLEIGWPDGVVLNINYPNCLPEGVKACVERLRVNAIQTCFASLTGSTPVGKHITGLASSAVAPSRQKELTFGRFAATSSR
jgi:5'-nucleotidase